MVTHENDIAAVGPAGRPPARRADRERRAEPGRRDGFRPPASGEDVPGGTSAGPRRTCSSRPPRQRGAVKLMIAELDQTPPQHRRWPFRSLWLHKLRTVPVRARHHHRRGVGHLADGVRRGVDAGRPGRHQAAGGDQHHRPQRQSRRTTRPPRRKSFVATYGLTYGDYEKFETLDGRSTAHVPMRRLPQGGPPARAAAQRPASWHHARNTRKSTSSRWPAAGS